MNFKGKKILMFYPYGITKHYGYYIQKELESRGAIVYAFDERPSQSSMTKIIIRLMKKKLPQIFISYLKKVIGQVDTDSIDYIIVLRGEAFTPMSLTYLRKKLPKAYFILYLWDILKATNVSECFNYFDKVLSFDEEDAKSHFGVHFRPTFFLPIFETISLQKGTKYDISYVATMDRVRYPILCSIKNNIYNDCKLNMHLYVVSKILYYRNKFISFGKFGKQIKPQYNALNLSQIAELTKQSRCVLDISYPDQVGLSMRVYEALAAHRKYITTNEYVKKCDFYCPENILVINRDNPYIPQEFVESKYVEIPKEILQKYSLKQWVDDVFYQTDSKI